MNETLKILKNRRSCRNFKQDMIMDEELKSVISAECKVDNVTPIGKVRYINEQYVLYSPNINFSIYPRGVFQ